jgi:3-deoxy-7-phosphoheptulonate synthase
VAKAGARALRGGAFKPRSSPYSFQGLGLEALKLLREAGDRFKLLVVSEVMEISQIAIMLPFVDIFQVGARNMQNFNLLRELGKSKSRFCSNGASLRRLKNCCSLQNTLWRAATTCALCERGIRTFETYTRNTLDISAVPIIHKLSHLPMASILRTGPGFATKSPLWRAPLWLLVPMCS